MLTDSKEIGEYIKFNRECTMVLNWTNMIFLNGGFHGLTNLGDILVYHVDQEKWPTIEVTREMKKQCHTSILHCNHCDGKLGVLDNTKE